MNGDEADGKAVAAAPEGDAAADAIPAGRFEALAFWLRSTTALLRREFGAYFKTPLGYIIMFFFYLVTGLIFWTGFDALNSPLLPPTEYPMLNWFMGTLFLALTVMVPAVTMRLLADEMRAGTLETLATAPVTTWQIVLSKYLAALGYYLVLLAPTVVYAIILFNMSRPHPPDRGPMVAGYLGLIFLGSYFLSIGIFASACTNNQIVAFIGAFMAILLLQLVYVLRQLLSDDTWKGLLKPFDFFENFMDFGRGVIDTRHIVYYLAMTGLFLVFTAGVLEVRKWKL